MCKARVYVAGLCSTHFGIWFWAAHAVGSFTSSCMSEFRHFLCLLWTVAISGSYTDQTLEGFMLVAVPLNAQDETIAMGTFQVTIFSARTYHVLFSSNRWSKTILYGFWREILCVPLSTLMVSISMRCRSSYCICRSLFAVRVLQRLPIFTYLVLWGGPKKVSPYAVIIKLY